MGIKQLYNDNLQKLPNEYGDVSIMYMEILSCHSNESTRATPIKNIIYVVANVMNIYAKFLLHPPNGFWEEDFWIFFSKFSLSVTMASNRFHNVYGNFKLP